MSVISGFYHRVKTTIDRQGNNLLPPRIILKRLNVQQINENLVLLTSKQNITNQTVLYLSRGKYRTLRQWKNLKRLIEQIKCNILLTNYSLETHRNMLDALYEELIAQRGANNVIIMGDSAGGGIWTILGYSKSKSLNEICD